MHIYINHIPISIHYHRQAIGKTLTLTLILTLTLTLTLTQTLTLTRCSRSTRYGRCPSRPPTRGCHRRT